MVLPKKQKIVCLATLGHACVSKLKDEILEIWIHDKIKAK